MPLTAVIYQSVIINIIVSATKYSIADQKKNVEQFLKNGLDREEGDLALNIKSVNFSYSTGVLSPDNVKQLSRIEILRYKKFSAMDLNQLS